MVLAIMIIGVLLIGVMIPRLIVQRVSGALGTACGIIAALAFGVALVYGVAAAADALGIEETKSAFDRGFNAWKIMLLLAPASAIHTRKQMAKGNS